MPDTGKNFLNTDDLIDRILSELQTARDQNRNTSLLLEKNALQFAEIAKQLPRIEKNLDSINEKLERIDKENSVIRNELNVLNLSVKNHSEILHIYTGTNRPLVARMDNSEKDIKDVVEKLNKFIDQIAQEKAEDKKAMESRINTRMAILAIGISVIMPLVMWLLERIFK